MTLTYEANQTEIKVFCGTHYMGMISPTFYVRREKTIEFHGMGTSFYYDTKEEAQEKLPIDLENYLKELITCKYI